ncbi:MAG: RyR domain-containing protein [Chlorobiales bacterium]|nr:RyR domain-containing protein [Chlorobiales bacterium]
MRKKKDARSVFVTGDVTIDWNIAHISRESNEPTDWIGEDSCRMSWQYGSAALLANLITTITLQNQDDLPFPVEVTSTHTNPQEPIDPYDPFYYHCYSVWAPYRDKEAIDTISWRVERFLGLDRSSKTVKEYHEVNHVPTGPKHADIIVIDDSNLGFRDQPAHWPKALTHHPSSKKKPWIIVKMSRPVAEGALWEHLVSKFSDRLIVVLTINDLRQSAIQVSAQISWEKTAQELIWELTHNPMINSLNHSAYSVVSFGPTGALLLPGLNKPQEPPKLLFDPFCMEREWHAGKGKIIGKTSTLVTAIVSEVIRNIESPDFTTGIQSGITAMRYLHKAGYDGDTDSSPRLRFPIDGVITTLMNKEMPLAVADFPIFDIEQKAQPSSWTILSDRYHDDLEELSQRIVLQGAKAALKNVPIGEFGELVTVDRQEIESLRSIHSLISEYCNRQEDRPVSIAVFGPPGSGKSFAVKQIAKVASPDKKIAEKTLTFNLSQFKSPADLIDAFHQIRDVALSGKIPLAFWDEFDSSLDGKPLGWLRFFLAPMQDGEFQQGQLTHPIGKAIFVFAGGTCSSLDSFTKSKKQKELVEAKAPDFLSRLKGFLNVLGPNPQLSEERNDPYFIIRRALLLRSLFERLTPQLFDGNQVLRIDAGIMRAFLRVDTYRHGSRSMEAIVAMSRLGNATHFNRSYLPPEEQLGLHVDPHSFVALVHHLELREELLEKLARLNHKLFCNNLKSQGYVWGKVTDEKADPKTHSALVTYTALTPHEQEQNRGAVRDIPNKLAAFGYAIVPMRNNEQAVELPIPELKEMAKLEHERWMDAKLKDGWKYSAQTNKEKKLHARLVDWERLSKEEKDKDQSLVSESIPRLLKEAGYTIVKLSH